MHFPRVAATLASIAVVCALTLVASGSGVAKTVPRLVSARFVGPITCIFDGGSVFEPPLTASSVGTSRVATTGELKGCTGNVTQNDWTVTGGIVLPSSTPSVPGNCNGTQGEAMSFIVYWQASPLSGAVAQDFPPPTRLTFPAPVTLPGSAGYVETWTSDVTASGAFHTSSGSQTLTESPLVSVLTAECSTPATGPPGIEYISTAGTLSI